MSHSLSRVDRFRGCLVGLAVGDALGSHFEGQSPESIENLYGSPAALVQNPPDAPWLYTDDTQMAIGVAETLLQDGEIVEETLCAAFVANYVPSRGYGRGTRIILAAMQDGLDYQHWRHGLFPGGSFGNGAAMRVAPVGLMFHHDSNRLWEQARLSALPTHVHPLGIEGAQLLALAIGNCLRSEEFEESDLLADLECWSETAEFQQKLQLAKRVTSRADLACLGNGFAAQESVVTAISCFLLSPASYEEVVANAILNGGDTDTIAAMAGAIAGAHLGIKAIPRHFIDCLEDDFKGRSYLVELADKMSAGLSSQETAKK